MQDNGDGKFSWLNVKPPYSCAVASPKKESKLKGLKSYIAYQLTPSVSTYTKYKLNQVLFFKFNFKASKLINIITYKFSTLLRTWFSFYVNKRH